MSYYNRTLGFVNAPALMQRALPMVLNEPDGRVDVSVYAENCRQMAACLQRNGFEISEPRAGFFLFPKLPERALALGEGRVEHAVQRGRAARKQWSCSSG